jgi:hypothetical protein
MSKIHFLVALLWLSVLSSLSAQGSFTTTSGASVRISGAAYLKLNNTHWNNSGTFTAGSSQVELSGALFSGGQIKGAAPDVFNNLKVNRSTGMVSLLKNVTVNGNIIFTAGPLNLNGYNITLNQPGGALSGENETSRTFSSSTGEVQLIADLNAPSQANPGNLGAVITSAANLGTTIIRRGHLQINSVCEGSIKRYFFIQPDNNSGLNATLRFHYFDAELNGVPESNMILFRSDNGGATWTAVGFDNRNTTQNWVEKSGIASFSMWTLADANWLSIKTWYLDADNDNYYTGTGITQCASPGAGYRYTGLTGGGDCDDSNAAINPGAAEISCNDIDENCNGMADDDTESPVIADCPVTRNFTGCDLAAITGPAYSTTSATSSYAAFSNTNNQGAGSDNCAILSVTYQDAQTGTCPITVARTWTLSDGTNSTNCVQMLQVNAPTVVLNCPADVAETACQTQTAIDAAFADWLSAFGFSGGCGANGAFDGGDPTAPPACGGSVTATYRVTSACAADAVCTKTFTVANAPTVVLNCPADVAETACQTQTAIDAAFADWLSAFGFSGGCGANGAFDGGDPTAPSACGGSVTATYRVTSACAADAVCTKTFTVANAPAVVLNCPADVAETVCQTQTAVDAAFADWLNAFGFSGGCGANGAFDGGAPTAPPACGGSVTATYRVTSACAADAVCTKTFTVAGAPTVVLNCPEDVAETACQTQTAIDAAFADWLNAFGFSGGCGANGAFDGGAPTAPSACGGSVTATYRVTSACAADAVCTKTFAVAGAPTVVLNCPADVAETACQTQTAIDAAFADWLSAFGFSGGCGANGAFDGGAPTAPSACGGSVTATYRVTSTCAADAVCTKTFTVAGAPTVVLNCPADVAETACQTQSTIDAAFADWLSTFGFSGGCGANGAFDGGAPTAPPACGGSVTATYRVTSTCAADAVCTKTFTVANAPTVVLNCPADVAETACQTQTAIDAAFADWLSAFGFSGGCGANGAFDGGAPTAPPACGGSVTATYRVTSACAADAVCTKTFTVANAPVVVLNCPADVAETACQTQTAIDAAFADWLSAFGFSGGCGANGAFDGGAPTAPPACGGSVTATYRVTSACAADAVCTKTFTVANAPVVLDCPENVTVSNCQTQAQVNAAFLAWLAEATFSGGCGASSTNDAGSAPPAGGGIVTVIFRVQSACATDVTCSRTFTVSPAATISLICPQNIVRTTSEDMTFGDCISTTMLTHPIPNNGCPPYTLTVAFSNGTPVPAGLPSGGTVMPGGSTAYPFAAGQTIVTYQVSDVYGGNASQCAFTVTVTDDELPLINCPGPVTVSCSGDVPQVNLNAVTVSDACGGVTKSHVGDVASNMTCTNRKTITRTYRAVDASNIPATCTQVITVFDNILRCSRAYL